MRPFIAWLLMAATACAQTQVVSDAFDATGQTPGASVDNTVIAASMFGSDAPTFSGTAGGIVIDSTITESPYYKFSVNGTTRDLSAAVGFKYDHTVGNTKVVLTPAAPPGIGSIGFLYQTTMPTQLSAAGFDIAVLKGNTGKSAYAQWNSGSGAVIRGGRLETIISNVATFSSIFTLNERKTYWFTMVFETGVGAKLRVYDPVTWQQVGIEVSLSTDAFATISSTVFGVDNATTYAGYFSYFKAFVWDVTGKFPLGVPETPSAPTSPSASALGNTSITVSWTPADTKEQGFQVFRSTDNVNFGIRGTAAALATSFTDTGLSAGTTYYYQVRAHNISFDSAFTATVNATTTGQKTVAYPVTPATVLVGP